MNILATEYNYKHKALEVYVAGCKGPHCPGCHNPESWDFNQGIPALDLWTLGGISRKVDAFPHLIDSIWVLGGEPLDQDHKALDEFLGCIRCLRPIWLFTRYEIEDVPQDIMRHCSYIKTGRYDAKQPPTYRSFKGLRLASANQRLHYCHHGVYDGDICL